MFPGRLAGIIETDSVTRFKAVELGRRYPPAMTKALRHRCIHWNGAIRPCVIIAQALAIAAAVAGHLVAQGSSEGVAGAADLAFGAETPEPGAGGLGTWIEGLGPWAYVVAPLFTVIVAILPIPAELPAVLNGMLFGLGLGVAVTWGGAFAGALLSFELARRAGRPLAVRVIGAARMAQADRLMQAAGWPALLVLRLIPVVAFTAINWGAGFTSLGRWTFAWTTAVGILPGAILFTTTGAGFVVFYRQHPILAVGIAICGVVVLAVTLARYYQIGKR